MECFRYETVALRGELGYIKMGFSLAGIEMWSSHSFKNA